MTDFRCRPGISLLDELEKLMRTAGIGEINFERKLVAIKMRFGEPGNLASLRPNYAKMVADVVKSLGGVPFFIDCNTLYPGRRKNALKHLDATHEDGFSPLSTGCQVITGDGLWGNDNAEVPVEGTEYIQTAKIGKAIMEADVIISLLHFKGHEQTGFGGAIENLGMGCGSRRGKMRQHAQGKPVVAPRRCVGCRRCATQCAHGAITFGEDRKMSIDWDKCVGCGRCIAMCNTDAVHPGNDATMEELDCRMAKYAKVVVDGRSQLHISLVIGVSPYCDCHGENNLPIVFDVGMFASFDSMALDQVCAGACGKQPPIPGSHLGEQVHRKGFCDKYDHFINSMPDTDRRVCLAHCEKIGIGTRSYELVEVKQLHNAQKGSNLMDVKNILAHCDHTLLKQESTWAQIGEVRDDGLKYGCAPVYIPASFVEQAADYVGSELKICTVTGFPNSYSTTAVRVFETEDAIRNGADEIDMTINIGWVKDQRWDEALTEIKTIKASCQGHILKVIVEACLLTGAEKIKLCELVTEPGADYIRTSTGFSISGATREDVALFKAHIGPNVKIRAAGGISSLQGVEDFIALGTDRLGTSRIIKLVKGEHAGGY